MVPTCQDGSGATHARATTRAGHPFRRLTTLAVALALGPASAWAQSAADPRAAQPERPSLATHAYEVAPGFLEIEAGAEMDRLGDQVTGDAVPIVFKLGLADRLQLTVQTPLARPGGGALGVGDVSVGVKWRLGPSTRLLGDLAVLPVLKLPSGSVADGTGTGTTDIGIVAISSRKVHGVSVDVNGGYARRSGDGEEAPKNTSFWTVCAGGPLVGQVGWIAEVSGVPGTAGPAGSPPTVGALFALDLGIRPWLVLDAGMTAPFESSQPRAFFAGLTYNAGRLFRHTPLAAAH